MYIKGENMNKKPVVLVIMDGLGNAEAGPGNSVTLANKPNIDKLWSEYPTIQIRASEKLVGLPMGQMGNSEVGHLNIGAGRIVKQSLVRIDDSIEDGSLEKNEVIQNAINHAKANGGNVHILGLASDGGVHAHQKHMIALHNIMSGQGVEVYTHAFTDGRDVEPTSADKFIREIEEAGMNVVSISGRYYSMDRDTNWDRTKLAYDTMVNLEGKTYTNVQDYIASEKADGRIDEFILPAYNSDKNVQIKPGDAIVFANFRPDRARQISHLFVGSEVFDHDEIKPMDNIYFASMMQYAGIPANVIFKPEVMKNLIGEVLAKNGLKQMRAAETEKYPHVTFFMDGGEEIDHEGQIKILVKSPAVATYDLQPEMSAPELTDKILENIADVDVALINYANPDMVGHSGSIEATTKAVEAVDTQLGRLMEKVEELGGVMIITADHGNAETMLDENGNTWTAHTTVPVNLSITDKNIQFKDEFVSEINGKLGDIAPTILALAGVEKPEEMTGESLIK